MLIQVGKEGTTYPITNNEQLQFSPEDDPFTVVTVLVMIDGKSYFQKNNEERQVLVPGIYFQVAGIFFRLLDEEAPNPLDELTTHGKVIFFPKQ